MPSTNVKYVKNDFMNKIKKQIIISIILYLLILAIIYLGMSFIYLSLNPFFWEIEYRVLFSVVMVAIAVVLTMKLLVEIG